MIIDCHGHYTTAPPALQEFRDAQLARLRNPVLPVPAEPEISDDEIRATIEGNQLRIARERGHDLTIFSPRASAMGHHIGNEQTIEFAALEGFGQIDPVVEPRILIGSVARMAPKSSRLMNYAIHIESV